MSANYEQLALDALEKIEATTALAQLDQIAQQAAAGNWSYSHFLGRLLEPELAARRQRIVDTTLRFAGLPWTKRLADFDFSFQPSIDRTLVEELATGRFLADGRNVVFLGPPGVGKTHLAIALGMVCVEAGHRLLFLSALELARRMNTAFAQNRLPHYLKTLTTPRLLIVDEVGYLGLDAHQASMLFQVICSRYEKQVATIVTSNKAFADWGHVFAGDAVMASAALDRLLHRATVINIKGESYRLREKRHTGLFPGSVALEATKGSATSKKK
ncbi:MAG: IS21-like element helper ATPase IstB [Polyangiaceae bacterium]|jgi:DNA replication protein DnaC